MQRWQVKFQWIDLTKDRTKKLYYGHGKDRFLDLNEAHQRCHEQNVMWRAHFTFWVEEYTDGDFTYELGA